MLLRCWRRQGSCGRAFWYRVATRRPSLRRPRSGSMRCPACWASAEGAGSGARWWWRSPPRVRERPAGRGPDWRHRRGPGAASRRVVRPPPTVEPGLCPRYRLQSAAGPGADKQHRPARAASRSGPPRARPVPGASGLCPVRRRPSCARCGAVHLDVRGAHRGHSLRAVEAGPASEGLEYPAPGSSSRPWQRRSCSTSSCSARP